MKRTGRRLQAMEGNGIVYDDVTQTGPPTSDAHLYGSTRLRQIQIKAGTVTLIHADVLMDLIGNSKALFVRAHEECLVPAQGKPR